MEKEKFSLVWWNTSLAPTAKSRANDEQRLVACRQIDWMVQGLGKDLIVLGEVSDEDIGFICNTCALDGYQLVNSVANIGRSSFDTCFIYNEKTIKVFNLIGITSTKGGSTLKIAQRIDISFGNTKSVFNIFASHWPSRLWCEENHADRSLLGIRLNDSVNEIMQSMDENGNPHIILLGDYNDEPFSESISDHLMATRDRNLVSKRNHLFYNPFWKTMAATREESYICGSYFDKRGKLTQWRTFDQMMFSHAFIAGQEWRLIESGEQILLEPQMHQQVINSTTIFDHFPITCEIEKVN